MQIVIDICEYTYKGILKGKEVDIDETEVINAVKNGVVLPKGHGRLIDADELEELFREVISGIAKKPEMIKDLEHMVRASAMTIEMIGDAPTIIEADKEVDE